MKLGGAFKPIGPLEVQQALEAARARGDDETEVAIHKLHPGHPNPDPSHPSPDSSPNPHARPNPHPHPHPHPHQVAIRGEQYTVTLQGTSLRQSRKDNTGRWR